MNVKKPITPGITVADQPTEADLKGLKEEGYVGVVNLRTEGEPEQPIGPAEEAELARAHGLDYHHHGVGSAPLTREGVTAVCAFLDEHASGKTLVHCRKGGRAAAIVLIYRALAENWTVEEAFAKGKRAGAERRRGPAEPGRDLSPRTWRKGR